jgi:hypothetical protein
VEPDKIETPVTNEPRGEASRCRPPGRKRRFQIKKLEERIAPGGGHGNGSNLTCGGAFTCARAYCH